MLVYFIVMWHTSWNSLVMTELNWIDDLDVVSSGEVRCEQLLREWHAVHGGQVLGQEKPPTHHHRQYIHSLTSQNFKLSIHLTLLQNWYPPLCLAYNKCIKWIWSGFACVAFTNAGILEHGISIWVGHDVSNLVITFVEAIVISPIP